MHLGKTYIRFRSNSHKVHLVSFRAGVNTYRFRTKSPGVDLFKVHE